MKYAELIRRLQACKGTEAWSDISRLSGVRYDTLAKIARGYIKAPSVQKIEQLAAALEKLQPQAKA